MPKKIGRYELKGELGRGGMATVYLAHDPRFNRDVAIKVLPREFLHDPKFHARFEREAKTIASLEHPAIVPVHDFGEEEGQPFLVMRHMPGGSLADRINKGPLLMREAGHIIAHLAPALDEAHVKGIIHRDLKPGNILFDQHGNPYLSDFGIVKIAEATATLTGTGIIGTPAYMSPEQVLGNRELDGRSDIYALGVILFQMLTGKLPYEADTPISLAFKHVNEPLPSIRDIRPELPAMCNVVIMRAMAKDADERYQTAGELAAALTTPTGGEETLLEPALQLEESPSVKTEVLARDLVVGAGAYVDEVISPAPPKPRRRVPVWIWITGGLAILSVIVGYLIIGFRESQRKALAIGSAAAKTEVAIATMIADLATTPTSTPTQILRSTITPAVTIAPDPTLGVGSTMVSWMDGMVMMYVPQGTFLMGSYDNEVDYAFQLCEVYDSCKRAWFENEQPQHEVTLDAFWIDKTEVTNAMFSTFLNEEGNQTEGGTRWLDLGTENVRVEQAGNKWQSVSGYENHPAVGITWFGARAYCEWAGRRLPTEAEWEMAARGMDGRIYPWGYDDPSCRLSNYYPCVDDTVEVGSYMDGVSPYGVADMAGNVWEWVSDWYDEDYYYMSPSDSPTGPSSGNNRVQRGGSWYYYPAYSRAANRYRRNPSLTLFDVGFRCANDVSP